MHASASPDEREAPVPDNAKRAPLRMILNAGAPAVSTPANDLTTAAAISPVDGVVSAVELVPSATITGAATNHRAVRLVNKGAAGAGTAVVAELTFDAGASAPALRAKTVTLSTTPADLAVAAGDVLAWESDSIGTGIADPGGLLRITVDRA